MPNPKAKKNKGEEKRNMKSKIERRILPVEEFRIKKTEDGKSQIVGHAAVFDMWSDNLGGFREKISPGAFTKASKSDTRMLFNHDPNYVLGRKSAKTLKLQEDQKGLYVENTPPDTQWARDLMVSIERGDINQMSFGFRVDKDEWFENKDGEVTRTIVSVKELIDVSPVTFPAYPDTDVALRSMDKWKKQEDEKEQEKRDADAKVKADEEAAKAKADAEAAETERLSKQKQKELELGLKEKIMVD